MGFLLFLLTGVALAILTIPLWMKEKFKWRTLGTIFIGSIILAANGVYRACQDNRNSHSIGKSGACSWHGGVVTRFNDLGWILLIISLVIIVGAYLYLMYKDHKENKKQKK